MATLADQLELEINMVQSAVRRYHQQKHKMEQKSLGSKTPYGRTLITGLLNKVSTRLKELLLIKTSNRDILKLSFKPKNLLL